MKEVPLKNVTYLLRLPVRRWRHTLTPLFSFKFLEDDDDQLRFGLVMIVLLPPSLHCTVKSRLRARWRHTLNSAPSVPFGPPVVRFLQGQCLKCCDLHFLQDDDGRAFKHSLGILLLISLLNTSPQRERERDKFSPTELVDGWPQIWVVGLSSLLRNAVSNLLHDKVFIRLQEDYALVLRHFQTITSCPIKRLNSLLWRRHHHHHRCYQKKERKEYLDSELSRKGREVMTRIGRVAKEGCFQ